MSTHTLRSSEPGGAGLRWLRFDAPLAGHTLAGQFTTALLPGGRKAFFALANVPGAPVELLVKEQGEVAEALVALPTGAQLELSPAMGHGFGLPDDGAPLTLLVAGSGLSAVRPLIEVELARPTPRPMTLWLGVFTLDHVPFAADVDAWARRGVTVHVVLGTPPDDWTGARGFAQHAARDAGHISPSHRVVVCGFGAMVDEVRQLADAAGVSADRVHTNY